MSKIGIMGGTFDPVHNGHLALGRQAYEEYGLDQIWFLPAANPPHKQNRPVTAFSDRYAMVRRAIAPYSYFKSSDFETRRDGKSYTAQTLQLLREQYPEHEFYFIIGADSLFQIETWFHPEQVMALSTILVAERSCPAEENHSVEEQISHLKGQYGSRIFRLHCREMDVSSEQLRHMAADGCDLTGYVPFQVMEYIQERGLYRQRESAESGGMRAK